MKETVNVCTNGACGGRCYRCRCRRQGLRIERLEVELRDSKVFAGGLERATQLLRQEKLEVLEVLKKTAPILDAVYVEVGSKAILAGGDPRGWKMIRDLVEATIKTIDPDWESPREQAEADALARRN